MLHILSTQVPVSTKTGTKTRQNNNKKPASLVTRELKLTVSFSKKKTHTECGQTNKPIFNAKRFSWFFRTF